MCFQPAKNEFSPRGSNPRLEELRTKTRGLAKQPWNVISSVFTLYYCLSGPKFPPLFPWLSNTMCCNLIIYLLSLVHQRRERESKEEQRFTHPSHGNPNCLWELQLERGKWLSVFSKSPEWMMMKNQVSAEEANNGLPNTLGHPGTQPSTYRSNTKVMADHFQWTHVGWFFTTFAIFQPLWCHTEDPEEPNLLVKVPLIF